MFFKDMYLYVIFNIVLNIVAQSVATPAVNPWIVTYGLRVYVEKTSQLIGKTVVWSTGMRKPGNTWVVELVTVM